jgi:hypothetical protein
MGSGYFQRFCELLEIDQNQMAAQMTHRKIVSARDTVVKPMTAEEVRLLTLLYIDYSCGNSKKVGELRDDIGASRYVLTPSFRKSHCHPQKATVEPGDAFEKSAFYPVVWSCIIINKVVPESQFFFSLLREIDTPGGFLALSSFT